MKFDVVDDDRQGAVIKVVGVRGAGGNAVQHMINKGISGVELLVADADATLLKRYSANNINVIKIDVEWERKSRRLLEKSCERLEDALRDADMVFIAASMGGWITNLVAKVAKLLGALTVAVVSMPMFIVCDDICAKDKECLETLECNVDSLVIIISDTLENMYKNATMMEWFVYANEVLCHIVTGITGIITSGRKMNMDFDDVKTIVREILREQGKTVVGMGVASGIHRARFAAEQALLGLWVGGYFAHARGILVNITGNSKLKEKEIKIVKSMVKDDVKNYADKDATIIHELVYNEDMGENIRVMVVATGLRKRENPDSFSVEPIVQTKEQNRIEPFNIPAYLRKLAD